MDEFNGLWFSRECACQSNCRRVHAWATVSLCGHAPEMQVSRWGLPLITHLFLNDPGNQEVKEAFNKSVPSEDIALFLGYIADYIQKMTTYAGSAI
jgi:hypothetical protein